LSAPLQDLSQPTLAAKVAFTFSFQVQENCCREIATEKLPQFDKLASLWYFTFAGM
jgi:hypothetical protein